MKRLALIVLFLSVIPLFVNATEYPGALFLTIYPGARAIGMAGAFSAIADDATATYYNPAGLAFQRSLDLCYDYGSWIFPEMQNKYISLSLPISNRIAIGPSVTYFSWGETDVTDENGNYLGVYTPYDLAVGLSAGIKINKINSFGITAKYIHSLLIPDWVWDLMPELGGEGGTANTVAFDFGTLSNFSWILGNSGIALTLKNIGPQIKYSPSSNGDPLPLTIRLGLSHQIHIQNLFPELNTKSLLGKWFLEKSHIGFEYDIRKDFFGDTKIKQSFGVELCPIAFFSIRFGYFNYPEASITSTLISYGFDLKFLRIDWGDDTELYSTLLTHRNKRLTIALNIGTPFLSDGGILGLFNKHR